MPRQQTHSLTKPLRTKCDQKEKTPRKNVEDTDLPPAAMTVSTAASYMGSTKLHFGSKGLNISG